MRLLFPTNIPDVKLNIAIIIGIFLIIFAMFIHIHTPAPKKIKIKIKIFYYHINASIDGFQIYEIYLAALDMIFPYFVGIFLFDISFNVL